jgi:hypothetical protein
MQAAATTNAPSTCFLVEEPLAAVAGLVVIARDLVARHHFRLHLVHVRPPVLGQGVGVQHRVLGLHTNAGQYRVGIYGRGSGGVLTRRVQGARNTLPRIKIDVGPMQADCEARDHEALR